MTDHVARLYAVALAVVVFALAWAVVAAKPWAPKAEDPRLAALERREVRLRRESVRVQRLVNRRFARYQAELRERQAAIAAASAPAPAPSAPAPAAVAPPAPSVSVVSAPPVTATASS